MTLLDYAIQQAMTLPYEQGKVRMWAVIVDAKGRVLTEGHNSYTKTHPVQAMYAEQANLPDKVFLHAEMSALIKLRQGIPNKIYIARVDSEGTPCIAAPCPICCIALKEAGIEIVEHTI